VLHDKHARITEILVVVSAPWSETISRNVTYTSESELKITRALIDELVESVEAELEKQLLDASANKNDSYTIVERSTIDVRVNDYPIERPFGLKGKEISLVHVTGRIPNDIIKAVEDVEEKIFPHTTLRSHTFLLVLYCVLREIYKEHMSLTMVHVTGESTEFGIVENGTLVESISIPHGINSIVRSLMKKDGQTAREIYSMLELYHAQNLTAVQAEEVEKGLAQYTVALEKALQERAHSKRFPKQTFVLAPGSFSPLFSTLLKPLLEKQLGAHSEILTLTSDVLGSTGTHNENDTSTIITSRFFHKLHGCGEIDVV
jgi:hypothetical protein